MHGSRHSLVLGEQAGTIGVQPCCHPWGLGPPKTLSLLALGDEAPGRGGAADSLAGTQPPPLHPHHLQLCARSTQKLLFASKAAGGEGGELQAAAAQHIPPLWGRAPAPAAPRAALHCLRLPKTVSKPWEKIHHGWMDGGDGAIDRHPAPCTHSDFFSPPRFSPSPCALHRRVINKELVPSCPPPLKPPARPPSSG